MTKRLSQLMVLLLLLTLLTACAEEAAHTEEVDTLSPEDWPQQVQATPIPTATPFPKLDDVAAEDDSLTEVSASAQSLTDSMAVPPSLMVAIRNQLDEAELATLTQQLADGQPLPTIMAQLDPADLQAIMESLSPAEMQAMIDQIDTADTRSLMALAGENANLQTMLAMVDNNEAEDLLSQVQNAMARSLKIVGTSVVKQGGVIKRTGPGESYPALGTVEGGSIAGIFGRDESGRWLYAITPGLDRGWLPLESLRILGSIAQAPVLSANPEPAPQAALSMATNQAEAQASTSTASTSPTTESSASTPSDSTASSSAMAVADLQPVTTASLKSGALNMRQGPGANYGQLETLSGEVELDVLARNKTQDWLLVKTSTGQLGWVWQNLVTLDGSLADAPTLISATPDVDIPVGELAPISGMQMPGDDPESRSNQSAAPASTTITMEESPASSVQRPMTDENNNVSFVSTAPNRPPSEAQARLLTTAGEPLSLPTVGQAATMRINQQKVILRHGPGLNFGERAELTHDDEDFYLLGVDSSRQWGLINRTFFEYPKAGWVKLSEMSMLNGDSERAPVLATAIVDGNGVPVRSGPGLNYGEIGPLGNETMVVVRAIYERDNWVLVRPVPANETGEVWINRRFLSRFSSTEVPQVQMPQMPSQVDPLVAAYGPQRVEPQGTMVLQKASGGDIMVINADGTGLRRLTHGIDPVLSPDGRQVAFARWQSESIGSLWTINLDGTNERHVLGEIQKGKGPAWSPDGAKIALNYIEGGKLEYYEECYDIEDAAGRRPPGGADRVRVEVKNFKPHLCWDLPPYALWSLKIVDVADSSFKDIDGGTFAFRPTWNPVDESVIVSSGGQGLVKTDLSYPNLDNSRSFAITEETQDNSPVFSPDGRYLAVMSRNPSGGNGADVFRLNADGSGRVRLTKTPLWETAGPAEKPLWNNVAPTWSPDGQLVAFLTDRTGRWEVWMMNNDGSDQRPMFAEAVNNQLDIQYEFVDERVISWR